MSGEQLFEPIFCKAIEIEDPNEREAYINTACGQNAELRAQVLRLVEAHFSAGSFLAEPAMLPKGANGETELHQSKSTPKSLVVEVGPSDRIGHYKLLQQIGEGGMGVVFMAEQIEPIRRQVALKIIKAGMDSRQVIARFEAERQALALMDHHHIAQVLDAGTTAHGRPYFVMELVKGVPITEYCDQNRLNPRERLELFIPVCQAIQHAHQKGIIHRDIKPSNVLVTLYDGRPVPKVIDFGIAKATEQRLTERTMFTELGQIVGTMEYMSPEQAEMNQLDVDTRSDVYSLGVLLYELLTGTTPITKKQLQEIGYAEMLRTIREVEPPKPSTRLSHSGEALPSISAVRKTDPAKLSRLLRGDLDWIVMKALEKDRTRRYETANGMSADITRFLREEAIEARPPSASYKLRKFARRNKALLATLATIAMVLIVASVVSAISAIRALRAEKLAENRLVEVEQERNEKELARQRAVENEERAEAAKVIAEERRNEAIWNQYVARQFPIVDAWERRDFGHLEEKLEELVPKNGEPDFRGWEWAYFKDQCDQASRSIATRSTAWHPGKRELAAVAVRDDLHSAIELRSPDDASLIRTLAPIPYEVAQRFTGLCWSADGLRLAYAASDGRAVVLNTETGKPVFNRIVFPSEIREKQNIGGFDLSHDGKLLAVSNWHGDIELWSVEKEERIRVLHDPERDSNLESIAFNADSSHLAAALRWGRRTSWDVKTGESFEYDPQSVGNGQVAWHKSGKRFAATAKNAVAIYDLHEAAPVALVPHRGVADVAWIGDDRLVSSGYDHAIRIWNADGFAPLSAIHVHNAPIRRVTVDSDGQFIAAYAGGQTRLVEIENTSKKATVLRPKEPRESEIHYLAWDQRGRFVASSPQEVHGVNSFVSWIRVWDLGSEDLVHEQPFGLVRTLGWRADQQAVWTTTIRGRFHELDMVTGELHTLDKLAENTNVSMSSISPDGRWLALGDQKIVKLVDTTSREILRSLETGNGSWSIQWSNDSKFVAIGSWGTLLIWDPFSGEVVRQKHFSNMISKISWSPADSLLALGKNDGRVHVVAAKSLKELVLLKGHTGGIRGVHWSSDGRRIASASDDATIRIWDAATGHEVLAFHHPDELPFLDVAWSTDSRRLAAGDNYGNVYIWGSNEIKPLPPTAQGLATGVIARHIEDE